MDNEEIQQLKLKLEEKEKILKNTKAYLFSLEYELHKKNELIIKLKAENNDLKKSFSGKITNSLKSIKKIRK
ncbi:MAG: hypothetical protein IKF11_05175 [Methanobrevibacter sp.]|nr:hypothetical protein [Methanobrevibacter sp.]